MFTKPLASSGEYRIKLCTIEPEGDRGHHLSPDPKAGSNGSICWSYSNNLFLQLGRLMLAVTVAFGLLACDSTPEPLDWSTSRFVNEPKLTQGRFDHTATLLSDGQLLLTSGDCDRTRGPTAELYDLTDGGTKTGAPSVCRFGHTQTLLANDDVLVTGGFNIPAGDGGRINDSAELYSRSAARFTLIDRMTNPRHGHTATRLLDGRVLIAGGEAEASNGYLTLSSAELYDPSVREFELQQDMQAPRYRHSATLLQDGRVLLAGGGTLGTESAEIYDPTTDTFTSTGSMKSPRADHTATLLTNGKVLVVGGDKELIEMLASAELYDPETGEFAPTGAMNTGRSEHTATLLPNGQVLIAGGSDDRYDTLSSAELYDPITETFSASGRMSRPRRFHTATLTGDDRVLIVGGSDDRLILIRTVESFGPDTSK